jgi:hypothetical protein
MAGEFQHANVGAQMTQGEYHAILGHVLDGQALGDIAISNANADGLIRLAIGSAAGMALVVNAAGTNVAWEKRDIRSALQFFIENDYYGLHILSGGGYSAAVVNNEQVDVGWNLELTGNGALTTTGTLSGWILTTSTTQNSDAGFAGPITDEVLSPKMYFHAYFDLAGSFAASDNQLIGYSTSVNDFSDQNNIIAFRKNGTGHVFGVCDSGGSETTRDTGSSGGGSALNLAIEVIASTSVGFYKDGTLLSSVVTTNIYGSSVICVAGLTNGSGTNARTMAVQTLTGWNEI